jgi:signal transduction histidine kinase
MTSSGQVRQLPGSVELCCYRIVQEALTNAGRHAHGSRVRVDLDYDAEALSVRVVNDAPAARRADGRGLGSVPGAGSEQGFGLTGLRERVAMLRGEFRAGPDGGGGFAVCAVLPVPGSASPGDPAAGQPAEPAVGEPA